MVSLFGGSSFKGLHSCIGIGIICGAEDSSDRPREIAEHSIYFFTDVHRNSSRSVVVEMVLRFKGFLLESLDTLIMTN